MAGDATGSSLGILGYLVDRSVKGSFIHFLMWMIGAEVAASTRVRVSGLFQ